MTKHLTIYKKEKILDRFYENISQKNIAKYFKLSQAAISKIIKKYNDLNRKSNSGNFKKLTFDEILNIKKKLNNSKNFGANDVANMTKNKILTRSAQRYLKKFVYQYNSSLNKPELKDYQKVFRYRFTLKYINFSDEDRKRVIFSDETKIVIRGNDSRCVKS